MLKKMQRRFIFSAMAAFGFVLGLLVVGINIANFIQVAASQDRILKGIHDYNRETRQQPEEKRPPITEMDWAGEPGTEFTKRFFVVWCDTDGKITLFDKDYIASIDEQTAEEYAGSVLNHGKTRGYYKDYRYLAQKTEAGYEIVFLNVSDDMNFRNKVLLVSALTGLLSFLIVSVLVMLFSKRAIRPYVKNMEHQKQFITDAGHELKTPITSIVTSADILSYEFENNEWLENIQKQSARLTKLVSDMVTLSRLDEDMPLPDQAWFSVSEAAWEISESMSVLAKAKGKVYEQEIEEDLMLLGDRGSIQRLLSILLENAIMYSNEGGRIRMDIRKKHGKIRIEVYNTCELHEDPDVERWFDRFYRPDSSRSEHTGGTGIGLSMARAIVKAHNGEISAKCQDKKEIIFQVVL